MYSHEILELLKLKKNIINNIDYSNIMKSSQIDHIKYENDKFIVWTNDGYEFKFKLMKK